MNVYKRKRSNAIADQIQKGFAAVNGTSLYYEVAGEGHPLVIEFLEQLSKSR